MGQGAIIDAYVAGGATLVSAPVELVEITQQEATSDGGGTWATHQITPRCQMRRCPRRWKMSMWSGSSWMHGSAEAGAVRGATRT
eukprot:5976597-Pyramimonas_sp.AAC.1